jgi:HSP20 family protein
MANIAVRKENETRKAPTGPAREQYRLEPFRTMRELLHWDPFREMAPLLPEGPAGFIPSFEVKETKDGYVFTADVPGVKDSDLDVTLSGNRLTVAGKREAEKQEQTDTYFTYERSYGDFTRAFTLPDGIDPNAVSAELKDGVLTLTVKKTPETQPKKIAIQSAATKKS